VLPRIRRPSRPVDSGWTKRGSAANCRGTADPVPARPRGRARDGPPGRTTSQFFQPTRGPAGPRAARGVDSWNPELRPAYSEGGPAGHLGRRGVAGAVVNAVHARGPGWGVGKLASCGSTTSNGGILRSQRAAACPTVTARRLPAGGNCKAVQRGPWVRRAAFGVAPRRQAGSPARENARDGGRWLTTGTASGFPAVNRVTVLSPGPGISCLGVTRGSTTPSVTQS